jgi:hypothetical protein
MLELKRSFGLLGMVGFSFSIVTSWTALSGVLIIGVESGGPPVMIWGWLAVCIVTLAVAYSMAEMCSAYVYGLTDLKKTPADSSDTLLQADSTAGWLFLHLAVLRGPLAMFAAGSC